MGKSKIGWLENKQNGGWAAMFVELFLLRTQIVFFFSGNMQ